MAYGLRVWDKDGNLTLDVTDRITRVLGTFMTTAGTSASGTVINNELLSGTPWYTILSDGSGSSYFLPRVTFSGNQINWQSEPGIFTSARLIMYGVF